MTKRPGVTIATRPWARWFGFASFRAFANSSSMSERTSTLGMCGSKRSLGTGEPGNVPVILPSDIVHLDSLLTQSVAGTRRRRETILHRLFLAGTGRGRRADAPSAPRASGAGEPGA